MNLIHIRTKGHHNSEWEAEDGQHHMEDLVLLISFVDQCVLYIKFYYHHVEILNKTKQTLAKALNT